MLGSFAVILPKQRLIYTVCERQSTGACKGKMENHAVYAEEDLSALFQICHVCLLPVSMCDLPATLGSLPFTKSWLPAGGGGGVLWLPGAAPEFCREM